MTIPSEKRVFKKTIDTNWTTPTFQVFFLKDNEHQSVEVLEVEDINHLELKMRILQGESIFITLKKKEEFKRNIMDDKTIKSPWHFYHI